MVLEGMVSEKVIWEQEGYFLLKNQPDWVKRRQEADQRAKSMLDKAKKTGERIGRLPFIKSVSLSGTIAKGVMYEDSDVDYFVIAQSNRIWLAKFFLKLYKLIVHQNSSDRLCYNYMLSEDHLEIESKNIYTATELTTLIPISRNSTFSDFLNANTWVQQHFPNRSFPKEYSAEKTGLVNKKNGLALLIEKLLGGRLGESLDNRIMGQIQGAYAKTYNKDLLKAGMKTTKNVSKTHPNDMQAKVLNRYDSLLESYLSKPCLNKQTKTVSRNV